MVIEEIIKNFINRISDTPVFFEVPEKNIPEEFFLIEKTGSSMENHINSSTLTVKSYAGRLFRASVLNDYIKHELIYRFIQEPEIISVQLNTDYNLTDTAEKRYRYQAVFDIKHY